MNSGSECQTKTDRQIEDQRERGMFWMTVLLFPLVVRTQPSVQRPCRVTSPIQCQWSTPTYEQSVDECGMVGLWHHILNHPAQPEQHAAQLILNFLQPVSGVLLTESVLHSHVIWTGACSVMVYLQRRSGVDLKSVLSLNVLSFWSWRQPGISTFCGLHSMNRVGVLVIKNKSQVKNKIFFIVSE